MRHMEGTPPPANPRRREVGSRSGMPMPSTSTKRGSAVTPLSSTPGVRQYFRGTRVGQMEKEGWERIIASREQGWGERVSAQWEEWEGPKFTGSLGWGQDRAHPLNACCMCTWQPATAQTAQPCAAIGTQQQGRLAYQVSRGLCTLRGGAPAPVGKGAGSTTRLPHRWSCRLQVAVRRMFQARVLDSWLPGFRWGCPSPPARDAG